jgi:amidophosphoribosyltransferase
LRIGFRYGERFIRDFLEKAIADCMNEVEGSYSAVFLTGEGELVAFRDPLGFRPLVWGEGEDAKMFASESVALDINNVENFSDVKPGEVIIVKDGNLEKNQACSAKEKAHCMFEYVYFSRPDSIIEGKTVYDVRMNLGRNLARTYHSEADVVIPVPDTSRPAAEGVGRELGIPVCEGLIKNRYVWRTFIMPEQKARDDAIKLKMNPIKSVMKDKHVILVDDSIVRGTTSRKIIELVKKSGAKKVELWITCPPIISPCFYGIDIATHRELIAANYSVEEIAKKINADSLCYQTIEGLVDAIGLKKEELCVACLTGRYPTPLAQSLADKLKTQTTVKRYYEVED